VDRNQRQVGSWNGNAHTKSTPDLDRAQNYVAVCGAAVSRAVLIAAIPPGKLTKPAKQPFIDVGTQEPVSLDLLALAGILNAFNAGDLAEAEKQQDAFAAFRTDLYALGFAPAMVKRALYLQDPSVGASRQPALLPNAEQDAQIADILHRYSLL